MFELFTFEEIAAALRVDGADPGDAARAYDAEATRRYGAFARLNFRSTS